MTKRMTTGEVIKQLRQNHRLTQEDLGRILGVKKSAIQKYENGGIYNLKINVIRKICLHFKIHPGLIIFPERFQIRDVDITMTSIYAAASKLNVEGRKRLSGYIKDLLLIEQYRETE